MQIIQCFFYFLDQIVLDPEPKLLDVGAGAKKFGCSEVESEYEVRVPAPQP